MNINLSIECSPDELREFLGLPDVKPIQSEWLEKVGANMLADPNNFAADKMLEKWMSGASANADMLSGLMSAFMQNAGKSK